MKYMLVFIELKLLYYYFKKLYRLIGYEQAAFDFNLFCKWHLSWKNKESTKEIRKTQLSESVIANSEKSLAHSLIYELTDRINDLW